MRDLPKKLLLSLISLGIVLLLLEGVVVLAVDPVSRVNWTGVPKTIAIDSSIPGLPYMLRPNGTGTHEFGSDPRGYFDDGATLTYRINSLGFRGPDVSAVKPPRVRRIIGLGDSFTFGVGVRYEDTFLARLQRRLATAEADRDVEVLNLGAGGYNTEQEVQLLRHLDPALAPDVVVICFFLNDTNAGGTSRPFNTVVPRHELPLWRRNSRLLDHLAAGAERRRAVATLIEDYHTSFGEDAEGWVRARRALEEAKSISDRRGVRLVLAIFPVLWRLSDDYPFAEIHQTVAEFAGQTGIPVVDLHPAFVGHDGPELWVHPNNQHPNEVAHEIAAEALYGFLQEQRILGEGVR
jgi:lysophospholipase L1-like esterase